MQKTLQFAWHRNWQNSIKHTENWTQNYELRLFFPAILHFLLPSFCLTLISVLPLQSVLPYPACLLASLPSCFRLPFTLAFLLFFLPYGPPVWLPSWLPSCLPSLLCSLSFLVKLHANGFCLYSEQRWRRFRFDSANAHPTVEKDSRWVPGWRTNTKGRSTELQ